MNTKRLINLFIIPLIIITLSGCDNKGKMNVTEIAPYLFEVETYSSLDYDYADDFYATENDNWSGGGCSAVTKIIEEDRRIIGRNMDLNISNNCAYIIKTDAGKYKTIGLQYTFRDVSPEYEDVKKHGISSKWSKLLPFYCDDVLNDQGFYIEVNMRHGEYAAQGQDLFAVDSTNPNGARRVHMFQLPRYIAENCKTVEEAKEYVNSLDIYSKNHYWNYCFIMADATGKAALLEFSSNPIDDTKIHWFDEDKLDSYDFEYLKEYPYFDNLNYHAIAQTNFFINKQAYLFQDTKSGFGRMQTMQNEIESVSTKKEMFDLMDKISYSNFYKEYDDCKNNNFDPRSEQLGELGLLNSAFCMNPKYEELFKKMQNEYTLPIRALSRIEKQNANEYWESTFTEVVDIKDKSIFVRFYENNDMNYLLTFDGIKKVNSIE